MARFRSKIVEIDAVQITAADYNPALPPDRAWDSSPFSELTDWLAVALDAGAIVPHNRGSTDYASWDIKTLEGTMSGGPGDWIIRGTEGELYPCKPSVFARKYEPVD